MQQSTQTAMSALVTGTVASLVSTTALMALAKLEGRGALQPTHSTSHWLHGDKAAAQRRADASHTLVGYATHHASAVFWALPFEAYLARHPPRSRGELLRDAAAMSAIAAAVDYGLTPQRLTPGWELVLPKRSMLAAFASLALGLTAGALVSQELRKHASAGRKRRPIEPTVNRRSSIVAW